MFRKKGVLDRRQKETWDKNHKAIYEAIREIEINLVEPTLSKIKEQLKKNKIELTERSIATHLKRAVDKGELKKIGHVYSSKMKIIADTLYQKFIISKVVSGVPRLEGKAFDDFISKQLPTFNKLEQEYQKKIYNPFRRWQYKKKLKNLQERKERIEHSYIKPLVRGRLKLIEEATEIKVLSSKKFDFLILNINKIREIFAEILYQLFLHEVDIAESVGQRSSLENLGLNIIISFEPKRASAIPNGSTSELEKTVLTSLREFEEFPLIARETAKISGITKERLERTLQMIKRQKEDHKAEWERSKST